MSPFAMRRAVLCVFFSAFCLPASLSAQAPAAPWPAQAAPCADAGGHVTLAGTRCMSVTVPLNHGEPALPDQNQIDLFVRVFPAEGKSEGQLWLIAGGPGESGASLYPFIETVRRIAPHFDLFVPDHRGTGFSTHMCPQEEGPDSAGGRELQGQEWASCFGQLNADLARTHAFSIANAAQDLNLLMNRFDSEGPRFLYGVSYGTQLVLRTMAIAPPAHLDGIILDSLVPPPADDRDDLSHRSFDTDAVGRAVLARCDADATCSQLFTESASAALEALLADPEASKPLGAQPRYTLGMLLDQPATRAMIPNVIAGLAARDTAWLDHAIAEMTRTYAPFAAYPQNSSSVPLVSLISRSENNARPDLTKATIEAEKASQLFASPLPSLLLSGGFPTYQPDPRDLQIPTQLPPVIVLQGTLDPKTPYAAAREHTAMLAMNGDVTMVPVEDAPHFILMTSPEQFAASVSAFIAAHGMNGGAQALAD